MSGDRLTDAELEQAERVCNEASPGPWEWWTSCSFRRLTGPDGRDGGVLRAVVYRDGQPGVEVREEDAALIAMARATLGRLLREVRERRADDSKRAWVDAGAPMLGEPPTLADYPVSAERAAAGLEDE